MLGGLWEFPGARCREGESLEEALRRGVARTTGLDVVPIREIVSIKHAFSHFKITMYAFVCRSHNVERVEEPAQGYRWIARDQLDSVALHRVARKIADHVLAYESALGSEPV
jgi:A/G-specific adenine glycosylase